MPRTTGASGKLFVPPIGETSDNVFLRFYLEAIDDSGTADTVTRDILPQKVQFTLATEPAGLTVTLDGQPQVAPVTITGVVGMERELGATTPQTLGSTQYQFSSWSDGGAGTHRIATPAAATTYTARFTVVVNQPPTVSLTAPSTGSTVTVNTTTTLTATAADGDGSVTKVGFYDGATLIGEDPPRPTRQPGRPHRGGACAHGARHRQPGRHRHERSGERHGDGRGEPGADGGHHGAGQRRLAAAEQHRHDQRHRVRCRRQRPAGAILRRRHSAGR